MTYKFPFNDILFVNFCLCRDATGEDYNMSTELQEAAKRSLADECTLYYKYNIVSVKVSK